MAAFHGLNVPAALLVELVHEHDRLADAREFVEARGDPLVPAGNEYDLRVFLQGALKLFAEVEALIDGARPGIIGSVVPVAATGSRFAE